MQRHDPRRSDAVRDHRFFWEQNSASIGASIDMAAATTQPVPGIASPLRLSAAPPQYRLPPPALGAHTRAVLAGVLGMDAAQIDELARAGVVYASYGS